MPGIEAYNMTTSPLPLKDAEWQTIVTLPPSDMDGERGPALQVIDYLRRLTNEDFAALQALVDDGLVEFEWKETAFMSTGTLVVYGNGVWSPTLRPEPEAVNVGTVTVDPTGRVLVNSGTSWIDITGEATELVSFERTIDQPADGSDFDVDLPSPQASNDYDILYPTVENVDFDVVFHFPTDIGDRTTSKFRCVTSAALPDGAVIEFAIKP